MNTDQLISREEAVKLTNEATVAQAEFVNAGAYQSDEGWVYYSSTYKNTTVVYALKLAEMIKTNAETLHSLGIKVKWARNYGGWVCIYKNDVDDDEILLQCNEANDWMDRLKNLGKLKELKDVSFSDIALFNCYDYYHQL